MHEKHTIKTACTNGLLDDGNVLFELCRRTNPNNNIFCILHSKSNNNEIMRQNNRPKVKLCALENTELNVAKKCGLLACYTIQPCTNNYQQFRDIPSILYPEDGGSRFLWNAANASNTTYYHNLKDHTLNIPYAFDLLLCFCETKPISHGTSFTLPYQSERKIPSSGDIININLTHVIYLPTDVQ